MAGGIRGLNKLRRTLRRIPDEMTQGVRDAVSDAAEAVRLDAVRLVPRDTGDLARALDVRFGRDGFTAEVGIVPGGGKRRAALRTNVFYGAFVEFGTKGNPAKNIPPQPARPYLGPAFDMNKEWAERELRQAVREALRQASRGT